MAVSRVGASTNDAGSGIAASSRTVSYTLDATANTIAVRVSFIGAPTPTITGVTWNGTALTAAASKAEDGDGHATQIWTLTSGSITTGTHNVVVTAGANWEDVSILITGYSGVDTTTSTAGAASATTGTTSPATVDTSAAAASGDLVIDSLAIDDAVSGLTVGTGQSQNGASTAGAGAAILNAGSEEASTGTVTMSWTFSGTQSKAIQCVILKAGAAGSNTTIQPGLGSVPQTGQTPLLGFGILMPDQP